MYLDDQPLAQIDAGSPEVPTYLHPDHLGKPIYGTNSGGTQVWAANSDAFGVGTPSGSRTVNLRMPGQYYDSESGLFYNWNRYYNPATGRYISSDPIGIDGGLNTFLYAEASPVMYVDPEGLLTRQECIAMYRACGSTVGTVGGFIGGLIVTGGMSLPTGGAGVLAGPAIVGGITSGGLVSGTAIGQTLGTQYCPPDDGLADGTTNEMSKGGKQGVGHDYVRGAARAELGDYCTNLKKIMQKARRDGNSKLFNDAKATWKQDCRGK